MPSFSWTIPAVLAVVFASPRAGAQQPAQGFAVERLYPSAPGGGWVVMDALDMRGGVGGAMALSFGYAHDPLRVSSRDGSARLSPVTDQMFAGFGFAATYDRWRLYLNMDMPLLTSGQSGVAADHRFTGPSVDLGSHPDTLSDPRIGLDVRILGSAASPFRVGAGAQLIFPNGNRAEYDSDGTYRAMARLLFAGTAGAFGFAGQLGVHVRTLDDSPTPGSPEGSELLFGVAAGPQVPLLRDGSVLVVVGPELFGQTAFRSLFGATATGVEGLVTGRVEGTRDGGAQLRVKLSTGAGINAHFGAPEWRIVFGLEVFDHHARHEADGRAVSPAEPRR